MHLRTGEGVYYVFILGNRKRNILEVGISGDLNDRLSKLEYECMKAKLKGDELSLICTDLLYWEYHEEPGKAIEREDELKGWSLRKKKAFVMKHNPEFRALNEDVFTDKHSLLFYRIGNRER